MTRARTFSLNQVSPSLHKWKVSTTVWGRDSISILARDAIFIQRSEGRVLRQTILRLCGRPLWLQATRFLRSSPSTARSERCDSSAIRMGHLTEAFIPYLQSPDVGTHRPAVRSASRISPTRRILYFASLHPCSASD